MKMQKIIPYLFVFLTGCTSIYYSAMEKAGFPKRDIFVSRVENARTSQVEAKEQFSSALDQFKSVLGTKSGDLDSKYSSLKGALDKSEARAKEVKDRIAKVEDVSEALFAEWKGELDSYL